MGGRSNHDSEIGVFIAIQRRFAGNTVRKIILILKLLPFLAPQWLYKQEATKAKKKEKKVRKLCESQPEVQPLFLSEMCVHSIIRNGIGPHRKSSVMLTVHLKRNTISRNCHLKSVRI